MSDIISFSNERSYVLADASIDTGATRGAGGPGYPRLIFRLDWKIWPTRELKGDEWIVGVSAQLFNGQDYDKIADAIWKPLRFALQATESHQCSEIEFPLDRYRVEVLEQRRDRGDMKLRIDAQLFVARFGERIQYGKPNPQLMPIALHFEAPSRQPTSLQIPESVWRKSVLPGLGYGVVNVLEFPAVPLEACSHLQHAYTALQRAHTKFNAGEYDEAIWQCRTAVDPLREELKRIKDGNPDSLSAEWAAKIGPATVDWLLSVLGKTYGIANTPVHSPNTGHFSRLDAQMVLTVATAVVAYVARTKDAGSSPARV